MNTPPEIITADIGVLFAPRLALARELRKARAGATQGEVFTPAVADYFRAVIDRTLREAGIENLLAIAQEEEDEFVQLVLRVNGGYDPAGALSFMPHVC